MKYDKDLIRGLFAMFIDWQGETTAGKFCEYINNNNFGFNKQLPASGVTSIVNPTKNKNVRCLENIGTKKRGKTIIYYDKRRRNYHV